MNAKADKRKDERITGICEVQHYSFDKKNEVALIADKITGIQALERIAEDLPMPEGGPVARGFENQRKEILTLIASINIATGKSDVDCDETRTEEGFDYFNETMVKPFKWTYQGKPLEARNC